jgi:hypothetical protein
MTANWKCLLPLRKKNGVIDGARTRDNQNHNLGLYQLSYDHHSMIEANLYFLEFHSSS